MALSLLDREHTVAGPHYNRWLIPPAALAVHLCIGQVYATSVYKSSIVEHFGTWVDTGGPRRAMVASATC